MDLIPAIEEDNLKRMGDIIWEIEFRGSKRAEVEHHSFEIYHYMSRLRKAGLEFVDMSSVGPSISIITGRERDFVEEVIHDLGLSIAVETKIDNEGLTLTIPADTFSVDLFLFFLYRIPVMEKSSN